MVALVGATLLGASCGGGSSISGSECSRGGARCKFDCAPNLGCVECAADSDCEPGAPFCVLGRCEACRDAADCGTGQACFPREHTCKPKCAANADCGPERETPLCDVATGACVGCLEETDCPAGKPVCEPTRAQCSACASDADCGAAAPACNLQEGKCEQCLVDADCDGAFVCEGDHKCHPACGDDGDCPDPGRKFCDLEKRSCVECLADMNCGAAAPVCKDDGKCVQCVVNMDCPMLSPICEKERCVECERDEDCPADRPKCEKRQEDRQCIVN